MKTLMEHSAELGYKPRSVERENQETVSEELLAELRELRLKADQETVMTKRKGQIKDRTAWVFLGGMVAASGIALFLVYTNYLTILKVQEMSIDVMQRNRQDAAKQALKVSPQDQIKTWMFPGALQNSLNASGTIATATLTADKPYSAVWKYYAEQTGYMKTFGHMPHAIPKEGSVPNISSNWMTSEGPQTVSNKIESRDQGGHPISYFTRHVGPNTVTLMLTPGASKNVTEITIYAMNAE